MYQEIIGRSSEIQSLMKRVEIVAPTDSTVLIEGETGTGKELIARAIYGLSSRQEGPFIKINCSAIPSELLESELFGHEKGAFTGAVAQRIGRFELANNGTLLLDELGDIPTQLQPKLLRVLQEHEFERLGSSRTIRVNVRVIAATNQDLGKMVDAKQFRADLYYRLNIFPIKIPPLRERKEDIPLLVQHFVHEYTRRLNKQIEIVPRAVLEALTRHPWPGNVRELQNLIERSVILSQGNVLAVPLSNLKAETQAPVPLTRMRTLEEVEREHILQVLSETRWLIGGPDGAAVRLGIKRTTLNSKMERLRIYRANRILTA